METAAEQNDVMTHVKQITPSDGQTSTTTKINSG